MNTIKWPKISQTHKQILLPELELIDADYEAAGEALRQLAGCFFEVVFVHEVAARHCRERQLTAELLRNPTVASEHAHDQDIIKRWSKPTPITECDSFVEQRSTFTRSK